MCVPTGMADHVLSEGSSLIEAPPTLGTLVLPQSPVDLKVLSHRPLLREPA